MRYFRDLLKIFVYIAIFYLPLACYSIYRNIEDLYVKREAASVQHLKDTAAKVQELLANNQLLEVCNFLEAQKNTNLLGVYVVNSPEASCHFPEGMQVMPPTQKLGDVEDFVIRGKALAFIHQKTGETEWTIGSAKPLKESLWSYLENEAIVRAAFLSDLVLMVYTICVLLFLAVLILAKSIQNEFRTRGKDPWWLRILNATFGKLQLHDLTILQRATQAYSQYAGDLKKDNDLLETSLEYSVLQEIKKRHLQIPYSFQGAVAKVDINGFSKIVGEGHNAQAFHLTDSLEEFGCELLRRYQGLFDKTVGDEIVAVFQGEDGLLLAASFARDLMIEFSRLGFAIGPDTRKFTLKGSVSVSQITFRKRHSGYGFDGEALTRTTRLLEAVTLKDRNVLCCVTAVAQKLSALAEIPTEQRWLEFKNMPAESGVFLDTFTNIEKVCSERLQDLKYFRSDSHIVYLLRRVCEENPIEFLEKIVGHLKTLRVQQCNKEVILYWQDAIQTFCRRLKMDSGHLHLFSKVIKLAENLIPAEQWDEVCTQTLLSIPRNLEDRVNASVIEVLVQKGIPNQILEIEDSLVNMSSAQVFRARGNILTARALHHLNSKVLNDLSKMVSSSNRYEKNTGIFCACEVILYYRAKNPAELETFPKYTEVVRKLNQIKKSDSQISDRLRGFLDQI